MGYRNGEIRILVKRNNWMAYVWDDFGASEFRLEVDTRPARRLDGGVGLVFGRTDAGYYLFEVSDGWFILLRHDAGPGTWTPLIDWTSSPAILGRSQTNRLKVIRTGFNIAPYVNGKLASQSFIPMGQFTPEGATAEPPGAAAILTGLVLETVVQRDSITGITFYWSLVNTFGAQYDVLIDPTLLPRAPAAGGVLSGTFWLSRRLTSCPTAGQTWSAQLRRLIPASPRPRHSKAQPVNPVFPSTD